MDHNPFHPQTATHVIFCLVGVLWCCYTRGASYHLSFIGVINNIQTSAWAHSEASVLCLQVVSLLAVPYFKNN